MNRIILIGNGFDLAHGLETSYRHFMDSYWKEVARKIRENMFNGFGDKFVKFERISDPASLHDACLATSFGVASNFINKNGYRYNDELNRGIIPEFRKALDEIASY